MAFGMMFGQQLGMAGSLVFTLISILVSSCLLWITAKLFRLKGGFRNAFVVVAVVGLLNWAISWVFAFLPIIGSIFGGLISFVATLLVGIMLIKSQYRIETAKAVLVWLIWFILSLVFVGIIMFIFILLGAGLAIGGLMMG